MATFVFYADEEHKRRADGRNTVVASGPDEAAARAAGEALIGPGALADFRAVQLSDAVPAFAVEGFRPVGSRLQSTFPSLTRGGDRLPAD